MSKVHATCNHEWEYTGRDIIEWCSKCGSMKEDITLGRRKTYKTNLQEMYGNVLSGLFSYDQH